MEAPAWLFTADTKGTIMQWNIRTKTLHKDWGKVHKHAIYSIKVTADLQTLFTSDDSGSLKQHAVKSGDLVKDYGRVHTGLIHSLETTPDNLFLFTCHPNKVER
jgi:WD40 repeat protein